ncbi:MAG: hypothetical protein PHN59_06250, partial [Candidatus Omnitrophica bacterium]|nr:hypothetical protein [Candidatus Omnitrophota bacterium]
GYRPPVAELRPAERIAPLEQLPAPEIQAPNQIASAYPDAGAPAQQIQLPPSVGNPSCDVPAQPAFVPRQPSVGAEPKREIAYGPGFNTMKSSSELYYFNRMIQKLPPEQRAQVASHADYINQNATELPISTRRHLGIPVDYSTITRENHNKLFIDREIAQDVTRRFYEPANQQYRDNIDQMNAWNGYNDPS